MILKARDAGKERFKKERMQERRDPRKKGCRKGGRQDRRKQERRDSGHVVYTIQYVVGICTLYSIMKMLRFSGFRYKERKTNF